MTKWVEVVALAKANDQAVIDFLYSEIFTHFGVPKEVVTDGGPQFMSHQFEAMLRKYHVQHRVASPYHPQDNGQVESTNKVIEAILTKIVKSHRRVWADRLLEALWAYHTTWRNTIGFSPYDLVYGKSVIFPIEFEIKTLKTATEVNLDVTESQKRRLNQLNELEENRLAAVD